MNVGGAFIHVEAGDIDKYIIIEKSIAVILVMINLIGSYMPKRVAPDTYC